MGWKVLASLPTSVSCVWDNISLSVHNVPSARGNDVLRDVLDDRSIIKS